MLPASACTFSYADFGAIPRIVGGHDLVKKEGGNNRFDMTRMSGGVVRVHGDFPAKSIIKQLAWESWKEEEAANTLSEEILMMSNAYHSFDHNIKDRWIRTDPQPTVGPVCASMHVHKSCIHARCTSRFDQQCAAAVLVMDAAVKSQTVRISF